MTRDDAEAVRAAGNQIGNIFTRHEMTNGECVAVAEMLERYADLIAEHERLTAPPTGDEREALASAVDLIDRNRATSPRGGIWADVDAALDLILDAARAGFRRQGPITDAQVEAAAYAFVSARYPNISWRLLSEERREFYRRGARAALEAARATS